MGKTAGFQGPGARPDPVRSFNRWKKKHSHKQSQRKQLRKQLKKPEWQVEREVISRLLQNYEKVRPALERGRWPAAGAGGWAGSGAACRRGDGLQGPGEGSGVRGAPGALWRPSRRSSGCHSAGLLTALAALLLTTLSSIK